MHTIVKQAAIASLILGVSNAALGQELKIGSPAPPLKIAKWIKGTPITGFQKGKVYVLEFWASW